MTESPTTLTPITQERIEAQLDGFGLKHFRGEDGTTTTAFPGLVCFFQITDAGFKISTRWLATARTQDEVQALRIAANDINRSVPLVRTHPITREDGTAVALIEAPFFTTLGASDEQLKKMLEFYFSAIHHVAAQLTERVPNIVDPQPEA
ncbi:YbjN domain-containing protein [Corynebacterium sp. TA-R-1]|uniref:YbjN domain-containing protein n=1 Tax=Corynebacterium stercoris TaxID=2943490 RepID=A0ABT1G3M7_9CORY|nr:YbjN domain-containing protein [Corynebacterium stercoris]MCP1388586.1 YbjN domain-containing protein [Corynebacterium stercoris]